MSDLQGTTNQDRQNVVLSDEHERRYFVEKFVSDYPGTTATEVVRALDEAAAAGSSFGVTREQHEPSLYFLAL